MGFAKRPVLESVQFEALAGDLMPHHSGQLLGLLSVGLGCYHRKSQLDWIQVLRKPQPHHS
jgi:hypothetical protein